MFPLLLAVLNRDDNGGGGGVLQSLLRTASIRGGIPRPLHCHRQPAHPGCGEGSVWGSLDTGDSVGIDLPFLLAPTQTLRDF